MPRPLPQLLALLLGVAAALLVACGGGTKGGIPSASAGDLRSQIEDVQQAVEDGRCEDVSGQLRQVDDAIDDLPATVDERLRQSLRDAGDTLRRTAVSECNEAETTTTETTTTETPTQTTETQTQTAPPETATAPPETTTTPPTVVPPPPPPVVPPPTTTPVPPPVEPPVPPPAGTPGGGATPEVGPQ